MSTQDTTPQTLFSRIWGYPIVHNTVLVAGEYYNHVKSYNPHSKMVLETAETYGSQLASSYWAKLNQYSGQPLVEDLICKADMFGCQQLDKIEDVCMKLKKASSNNVIHSVEHAISGTKVEGVLVKALNLVNIAVDTLLPALEEEESSKNETDASSCSSSEETALVRATTPVLLKLRGRLSKKGVLALPANTYHGVKDLALYGLPQLQLYVNTLSSLFTYILTAKDVTYLKGAYISQAVLEHIMQSLHTASSAFKTLANIFKNFDTIEARTSVVELAKMISASKDNISKAISNFHLAEKLKQEGSIILLHAGEALAHPIESLESGYTYVSYADIAIFKKVADSLELAIQTVVQSFSADKFKQS